MTKLIPFSQTSTFTRANKDSLSTQNEITIDKFAARHRIPLSEVHRFLVMVMSLDLETSLVKCNIKKFTGPDLFLVIETSRTDNTRYKGFCMGDVILP